MAIKINGKDLVKRIINWQEVSKVILNGSQIRPTYQQYVNYHVVSNFVWWGGWGGWGGGWAPSWRTNNWGVFGGHGVSNWGSGQVVNQKYNGLPSLKNAVKVEIIYQIYWDLSEITTPFDATLLRNQNREYYTKVVSQREQIFGCSSDITASLEGASAGTYTISTTLDLEHNEATQIIEWPNGFRSDVGSYTLNGTEIANIRNCNEFVIYLNNGISLSQVDFYIYNAEPTPPPKFYYDFTNKTKATVKSDWSFSNNSDFALSNLYGIESNSSAGRGWDKNVDLSELENELTITLNVHQWNETSWTSWNLSLEMWDETNRNRILNFIISDTNVTVTILNISSTLNLETILPNTTLTKVEFVANFTDPNRTTYSEYFYWADGTIYERKNIGYYRNLLSDFRNIPAIRNLTPGTVWLKNITLDW